MLSIGLASSSTVFLFCSPQYLVENNTFWNTLIQCNHKRTLRLVALDEVHLYTMHSQTFREAIRALQHIFFAVIFSTNLEHHPRLLAMTATMTMSILASFSVLTHVNWNETLDNSHWARPTHLMWASAYAFRQRHIRMEFRVTADISQVGFPLLVEHLKDNKTSYACVFDNFKTECSNWASKLKAKLAAASLTIDVLQITGDMDKDKKFAFIGLFTSIISLADFHPRLLTATGAANTGIDQERQDCVLRIGLPRCIITASL